MATANDFSPVALVMSDLGDSTCGVGNSVATLLDRLGGVDPVVVDPSLPIRTFVTAAREARRRTDRAVLVYPTRSTTRRPGVLLRELVIRAFFGRNVGLYLHEFGRLGRRHRAGVAIGLGLSTGRIVVCVPSEADAVRSAVRGLAARGQEVVAVPAVNGSAPQARDIDRSFARAESAPDRAVTVGVFGSYRPDKGPGWLGGVLTGLDRRYRRLEFAGAGWQDCPLPAAVRHRFDLAYLDHVPSGDLPEVFGRWGLAVAPFWAGGTHDGRTSLRTTLAYGVPTLAPAPRPGDLTLDVPHLLFDDADVVAEIPPFVQEDLRRWAEEVASFESEAVRRTGAALFRVG